MSFDRRRYLNQIQLSGFGWTGQDKLKKSRVLVVGLGGLGTPAAQYLTSMGVGTLGLIDGDTVALSNLPRQILYGDKDVGKLKVQVAKEKLHSINSETNIEIYPEDLSLVNSVDLFSKYDLVVDGTDNFKSKFLINSTALQVQIPWVFASISGYEGLVANFSGGRSCLGCLFPLGEKTGASNCQLLGVMGAVAGIVGTWQANEVVRRLVEKPEETYLTFFDFKKATTKKLKLKARHDCLCQRFHGDKQKDVDSGISKGVACGGSLKDTDEISWEELKTKKSQEVVMIDLRENAAGDFVWDSVPVVRANLADAALGQLPLEAKSSQLKVFLCHQGTLSKVVVASLRELGWENVISLKGGFNGEINGEREQQNEKKQ